MLFRSKQEKRIAELEAVLAPFAEEANCYDNPSYPYSDDSLQGGVPVGWLRDARAALENK